MMMMMMRMRMFMMFLWMIIMTIHSLSLPCPHTMTTTTITADGYCVELGHLESHEKRGQILATGQFIRFMTCVFAGGIQSFLLNGYVT